MSSNQKNEPIEHKLKRDLHYIERELIAKQNDGAYCKFSRALDGISIIGLTQHQYENYWTNQYRSYKEQLPIITAACRNKFTTGLISQQEMIDRINNSHDHTKDREKAIKLLGGAV